MTVTARRSGVGSAAVAIQLLADVLAGIIILWVALHLLDANPANDLVSVLHDAARWLAGWSHDLFPLETDWLRVVVNYGIAAVVYLVIGHGVAGRLRRL